MYLKSAYFHNFQSWIKQKIEFHKGFNAIIGDSDSGKSSLVKGIKWVTDNRPTGEEFKSWSAEKDDNVIVALEFEDAKITKKREDGKNVYKLPEGVILKAFKTDVPDEVQKLCNLQSYNIQGQHDGYFLLQMSPGERAKILNKAIGLDVIDFLFSFLNKRSLRISDSLTQAQKQKDNIKTALEMYANLDEIEEILSNLKELSITYESNRRAIETNKVILENIRGIRKKIEKKKEFLKVASELEDIRQKTNQYKANQATIITNTILLKNVRRIKKSRSEIERDLEGTKEKYMKLLTENKLCPTCGTAITAGIVKKIKESL